MAANSGSRFVWYDLMTNDVEKAKAFYGDVIGWKATRWPGGDYEMWAMGEKTYGGVMGQDPSSKKAGAPPMWLGYVGVEDVDATAKRAKAIGAKVLAEPRDIPDVGRFSVLADPQGAVFAIFTPKPGASPTPNKREDLGNFSWAELNTHDYRAAWKFYSELFGWKPTRSMNMGPALGEYFMFGNDSENSWGGMSNAATVMKAPPHWIHYINVKSADDTAKQIAAKGGQIMNGPMDIPGGDRVAVAQDPQGGYFAIYSAGAKR